MGIPGGHERELWDRWGPMGGFLWPQGSSEGSFGGPWGYLRGPWGVFGGPWEVLRGASGVIGGSLGDPRGPKEGLWEPLGLLLELFLG